MRRGGSLSGAASLIMIFAVLCLAVFATLTVATAERERKLSDLTAVRAAEWYEADSRAVKLAAAVKRGEEPAGVLLEGADPAEDAEAVASFTVPVNEVQSLEVRMKRTDGFWEIERWQTVYTGDWQTDEELTLWDFG